jgi:hypothetical protein
MEIDVAWAAPYEPGTRVLTAYYTPTGPKPKFHVTARMPMELAFGDVRFRAAKMRPLAADVRRWLEAFDRFLPS